jgi:hypothetical protein
MMHENNLTSFPVCMSLNTAGEPIFEKNLTERSVHALCKEIAGSAALLSETGAQRSKFEKFSPHWLRHFSASMQALSDIPFEMIKAHHRHAKDDTTRLYLHNDDNTRQTWADKYNLDDLLNRSSRKS